MDKVVPKLIGGVLPIPGFVKWLFQLDKRIPHFVDVIADGLKVSRDRSIDRACRASSA
jgi:hypothetical protein